MTERAAGGPRPARAAQIRIAALDDGEVREFRDDDALRALGGGLVRGKPLIGRRASNVWIDLVDPDFELVSRVAKLLDLHELIAEDIVEGNQRAKLEATNDIVHVVLFALEYGDATDLRTHEVDLVLGDGFLLSAHPAAWDPRAGASFRAGVGHVMRAGPDHVLWALCDAIVDAYFPFADRLEEAIDALQDRVVDKTDRSTLEQVFRLKRELIDVRRAVTPVREVMNQLASRELAIVDEEELVYFRDVYDHVIRLTDELDNDRELVAATLDVYLSTVNNNLSAIMKRLTGVTVILAGIGAIAGIFGMSEAGAAFAGGEAVGFWLVSLGTVVAAVVAALVLRKLGWI